MKQEIWYDPLANDIVIWVFDGEYYTSFQAFNDYVGGIYSYFLCNKRKDVGNKLIYIGDL